LGRQWSHTLEVAEKHVLVTDGIYARIRHPIYASLVLWAAAQPFLLQNVVAGWGGAVAIAAEVWLVRVPREEAMMIGCLRRRVPPVRIADGRLIRSARTERFAARRG